MDTVETAGTAWWSDLQIPDWFIRPRRALRHLCSGHAAEDIAGILTGILEGGKP
jgi:hypothetical protein